jgi:Flp pilus assembly pilin Flp
LILSGAFLPRSARTRVRGRLRGVLPGRLNAAGTDRIAGSATVLYITNAGVAVSYIYSLLCRFTSEDDGASMVEYALMLILVAFVCIAVVQLIGGITLNMFGLSGSI